MLRNHLTLATLSLFFSFSALAQNLLIQPDLATCLARSQAQCVALHCDGVQTKYWWNCTPLTKAVTASNATGSLGIQIAPGDPLYDVTTSNTVSGGTVGLSGSEQAAVQTAAQLGTALPNLIPYLTFKNRFTSPQITAINASVDPAVSTEWAILPGAALTNLLNPAVYSMLKAMVADGLIPASQVPTILAQTPVVPPS